MSDRTSAQLSGLQQALHSRFAQHMKRHPDVRWDDVEARLQANPAAWQSLSEMERTGGEPDVVGMADGQFVFMDCAAESPAGRRSLCFDDQAHAERKEAKPSGSAMGMAASMGIRLLTEAEYRHLQSLGEFDRKTSSWIITPPDIRALGGALFMDRRYGHVFCYHNGAQSYYAARGFRGVLHV